MVRNRNKKYDENVDDDGGHDDDDACNGDDDDDDRIDSDEDLLFYIKSKQIYLSAVMNLRGEVS